MIAALPKLLDRLGLTASGVAWASLLALATFVVSISVVTFLLVRLPATYFLDRHLPAGLPYGHPLLRWAVLILKNILGAVLVGVGLVMLITPGQGVLTILIGVMLLNFPGRRRLERKLVGRPRVLDAVNRLRARFGKAPLILPDDHGQPGTPGPHEPGKGK